MPRLRGRAQQFDRRFSGEALTTEALVTTQVRLEFQVVCRDRNEAGLLADWLQENRQRYEILTVRSSRAQPKILYVDMEATRFDDFDSYADLLEQAITEARTGGLAVGESVEVRPMSKQHTTLDGLFEALKVGDLTAMELIDLVEKDPELSKALSKAPRVSRAAAAAMADHAAREKRQGDVDERDDVACPTPGRKRQSKGQGRGLARGRRRGPIGVPIKQKGLPGFEAREGGEEAVPAEQTFADLVGEGRRPKQESLDKDELQEFAAPERNDVIRWARGQEARRQSEKLPYYFDGDYMYSYKRKIAERNLEDKTARVLSRRHLDARMGRNAVLAEKGLGYAGYKVEVVESFE